MAKEILIVEDNELNMKLFHDFLELKGDDIVMKGDEEKIHESGCEAYIAKPISVTNFLETVEQFLT
jgi:CheY-like chemotaxis protein